MNSPKHKRPARKRSDVLPSLLVPWLEQLKATFDEPQAGDSHHAILQTPIGGLSISIYPDWIACRFAPGSMVNDTWQPGDLEPARAFLGRISAYQTRFNPHSGKWNWHVFEFGVAYNTRGIYPEDAIKRMFEGFKAEVERILAHKPAEVVHG